MPSLRALRTSSLPWILVLAACGGSAPRVLDARRARLDADAAFDEARRAYSVLAPDAPGRAAARASLLEHLAAGTEEVLAGDDYDAVVRHLARMTELFSPSELAQGAALPAALGPLVRFVADRSARRGDEARAMAAQLLWSRLEPEDASHAEEYQRIAAWGREVRWAPGGQRGAAFFEVAPELFEVWEEHARLTPSPEVLDRLATLHVEFRDLVFGSALPRAFRASERVSMPDVRMARVLTDRLPLEVAAVYLRVGDLPEAARRVGQLGDLHGLEGRLRALIDAAALPGAEGADALVELAGGYERARPEVAMALARVGRRVHPTDARFPLALARLSLADDQAADATAWYAEAVELSPDAREVYDEALGRLAQLVEAGLFGSESNIGRVRAIGRDAARILAWRTARWPEDPPAVTASELDYHLARAELSDGHVRAARARLEASLASNRSREALVELARLEWLTGPPSRAVALYQEALDRSSQQGAAASFERAELLERLGDALRTAGDEGAARAAYTRALGLLRPLADQGEDAARALVRVRIGVLSLRTGATSDGAASFRAAIDVTPGWREPYLLALAHLVVGAPDVELAEELHHRAQVGVALEPEWRVYFALWVQIIEGRAGRPVGEDVLRILREQSERAGWHGRLAAFGVGTLAEAALFEAATTPGERCEAAFYAGARKLVAGDLAGARALLTSAIDTGMVGYFELAMARELLSTMR